MNQKKQEEKVKQNATLLDEKMDTLVKAHKDEYITFHEGKGIFSKSLDQALEIGDQEFGPDVGFVVRKIREAPIVFSNLISV